MRTTFKKKRRAGFSHEPPKLCPVCLNPMKPVGEAWECAKHGAPKS